MVESRSSRLPHLVSWLHFRQAARGLADCWWHASFALWVGSLVSGLCVWCRLLWKEWAPFSSDALTHGVLREEMLDYDSLPESASSDFGSGSISLNAQRGSFVTSRRNFGVGRLLCLCLCLGLVHGHDSLHDSYEPVGDRVLVDSRGRCARDAGGPERLTSGCGGSCLLARAPDASFEAPSGMENVREPVEYASFMQLAAAIPLRWSVSMMVWSSDFFVCGGIPFSARHYVRSDELKGIRSTLHTGNGRFRAFHPSHWVRRREFWHNLWNPHRKLPLYVM